MSDVGMVRTGRTCVSLAKCVSIVENVQKWMVLARGKIPDMVCFRTASALIVYHQSCCGVHAFCRTYTAVWQ